MSSTIVFNGTSYSIPAEGDSSWGTDLSNYLIAIASGSLQKSGGSFTLTAEIDFGANYGLKASYLKSRATNPASAGVVRLGNAESIKWRNQANNADLDLTVNSSDVLQFNGSSVLMPGIGSIVNADISNSAAIAYSKLNLTGNIVNADISNSAAIAYSKLNLSASIVNADISTSAAIVYSKLNLSGSILNADINASAAIAYSKLNLSNSILNADISSSAAIALSKLAALTTGKALQTNASTGVIEASSVTNTELSRLSGIGSSAVGISDTQVLTNKDIDGGTAANTRRLTLPKDTLTNLTSLTRKQGTLVFDTTSNKPYYDDGTNLRAIGSGSGTVQNLIPDGDAEGANIISVYNDSSTTRPLDGSGGVQANLAATITSTNPLSGTNSFLLTKSGSASTQGSGFSIPFTVPIGQQAKVLQIDIDYIVNSGTFVAGSSSAESDMIVYLYDVTNSTLIEPSSIKFLSNSSTISDKFTANFQTSATGTSYRLILHCQSTSTANYALKCEFSVKPCNYVYGTPITNDISFTPTLTNAGNATAVGAYRQVGSKAEIIYTVTIGSTLPTGTIAVSKPSNLSLGYSANTTIPDATAKGVASATGTTFVASVRWDNANQRFDFLGGNGQQFWNATVPFTWTNGDVITFAVTVPITGWSSSTQMSDSVVWDDDVGQVQAFAFSSTTPPNGWLYADGSAVNRATYADLFKKIGTTFGAGDGSTTFNLPDLRGIFVRGAGTQTISGTSYSGTLAAKERHKLENHGHSVTDPGHTHNQTFSGTNGQTGGGVATWSWNVYNNIGSNMPPYIQGNTTGLTVGNPNSGLSGSETNPANIALTYFIKYTRGVSPVISATEVVAAKYYGVPTGSIGSPHQTITYPTKAFDTHNAYSGGTYTIPVAGIYEVYAYVEVAGTETLGQSVNIATYKNGSVETFMATTRAPGTVSNTGVGGSTLVSCVAGDTIQIKVYTDISSPSYVYADSTPRFEIKRIK